MRWIVTMGMIAAALAPLAGVQTARAASVVSATFSGGAGTIAVGGVLYASSGAGLTLSVGTDADTRCLEVSGAHSATQSNPAGQTNWTFMFTAGGGNGSRSVTVQARRNANCTGQQASRNAGYVLDNTAPVVSASLSPAPNADGWNNADVAIAWAASDAGGSGIASGPTPLTDGVSAEGTTNKMSSATDRLGHTGSGTVAVLLDKTDPLIGAVRVPAPNANGWNNTSVTVSFTCSDDLSGIKSCSAPATVNPNGAGQSRSGTAVDIAGNTAGVNVSPINIDKAPPSLSGAPAAAANSFGWYNDDVAVQWTCADQPSLSGIDGPCPPESIIGGEGTGLSASASASDRAGNTTNATSSPPVSIDRTAPQTTAGALPAWNNGDVVVSLDAHDNLSGVSATYFVLDGGLAQTGTSVPVSGEGVYTIVFWSEDFAGNAEEPSTIQVKVDKTAPQISHTLSPEPNSGGWNNSPVAVTFVCEDALSGIAACTAPQTLNAEGQDQPVEGTAVDNAGNSATGTAIVSIDLTPPTIAGSAASQPNGNGWYKSDVPIEFACEDGLSGIAGCGPNGALTAEGVGQSVAGTAVDGAGNIASFTVAGINIDKSAPSLTGSAPPANVNGWYNEDVVVQWTCADQPSLSGIDGACPADTKVTGEGAALSASASVSDRADNSTTSTVEGIRIDRTAPTISGSAATGPNANGWYNSPVPVTFTCGDGLSGVESCGPDLTLMNEGAGQSVTGTAVDRAGNVATAVVAGIDIDLTGPQVGVAGVSNNAVYTLGAAPVPGCSASDSLSGVDGGCSGMLSGGTPNGVGLYTYVATATDLAGNTTTVTVQFRVAYLFGGFLQPIAGTAHQELGASFFKAGSTIPVKFRLKRADGSLAQPNSAPVWITPSQGNPLTGLPGGYAAVAASGDAFRWAAGEGQFIYNWNTDRAQVGYYWRIGVMLDDGQTYFANIGLR